MVIAAGRRHHHQVEPPRHRRLRIGGRVALLIAVTVLGTGLGVWLGGHTTQDVGPFTAELSLSPSLRGDTSVDIPPLGSLDLDSHDGPAHLGVRLDSLDESRTRALAASGKFDTVGSDAVDQLSHGVRRLGMQTAGSAVLGAMILAGLVFRRRREAAIAGFGAIGIIALTGLVALSTFRPDAIQEPKYRGLLVNAPAVVGDARKIADRYEEYRAQLQKLVANVSKLYSTISALPVYEPDTSSTKVLHISDMHLNPAAWTVVRTVADQFSINIVVDTGDINDWGSEPEASYVGSISQLRVPYVYVRGNHDSTLTEAAVAKQPNAHVLDNKIETVGGLTFAGIGDPRFTPDKETDKGDSVGNAAVAQSGEDLAAAIRSSDERVDVAMIHAPNGGVKLGGLCPLVLAGHTHSRSIKRIDTVPGPTPSALLASGAPQQRDRTLLMVQGSTGGAGLRGLESKDGPLPLALSILYFDQSHALQAYDDIQVGGVGLTEVSLERHLVTPEGKTTASPSPTPTRSPAPATSGSPVARVSVS